MSSVREAQKWVVFSHSQAAPTSLCSAKIKTYNAITIYDSQRAHKGRPSAPRNGTSVDTGTLQCARQHIAVDAAEQQAHCISLAISGSELRYIFKATLLKICRKTRLGQNFSYLFYNDPLTEFNILWPLNINMETLSHRYIWPGHCPHKTLFTQNWSRWNSSLWLWLCWWGQMSTSLECPYYGTPRRRLK